MIATPIAAAACATAVLAMTARAPAQMPGEVIIDIDQPVLMPGESTTVTLLAGFDSDEDFAMGGVLTSLRVDAGGIDITPAWTDVRLVGAMEGPGTTTGTPVDGGFAGILAGQIHDPFWPRFTDTSDPIVFWEATFSAPTDAGAFTVDLSTITDRFDVYIARDSSRSESRLDGLTEGSGTITVVPAPAGAFALTGLLVRRRRR
jgi:hypothetical protein